MNEQAPRALLFSIPSLSKELRTLKVRNMRFCFLIIIFFFLSFFWTRVTD